MPEQVKPVSPFSDGVGWQMPNSLVVVTLAARDKVLRRYTLAAPAERNPPS
jgi:hypothetical protein